MIRQPRMRTPTRKRHQERQYNRNRRRVEEISQIIETSKEEIKTLVGNDMDDDAEDGAE